MAEKISQKTARRLQLHAQLLDGRGRLERGSRGVARAVGHLGYVQIDTIAVIERAHHHVLWTRIPGYRPDHLHEAQAEERTVFEYWGHAASYLPMADYRFYLPMMKNFLDSRNAWFRNWGERFAGHMGPVRERIRSEGPLTARDFASPAGGRHGQAQSNWWDWKPAKAALELLFWQGELMVRERRGFERVYDLTERVLPADTDTRMPTDGELGFFVVRRALGALGIATEIEIRDYIRIGERRAIAAALREMLAAGEVVRLFEAGWERPSYALPAALEKAARLRAGAPRVRLLSPFDNLAISRSRLKERFAFDYALECYVPRAKRNHGYFVLPILFGEEIVGRLDPKAKRKTATLAVRQLVVDPSCKDNERLIGALGRALCDLARFNGCRRVVLESVRPAWIAAPLRRAIGTLL
jgi:uncharacterized protein YcaQ